MTFPQYRKYRNNKHFFKIISSSEFEEISFIGSKLISSKKVATILPDRNFIQDLLHNPDYSEPSTKEEYDYYFNQIVAHK
ncbi:MAG: hypothetical protein IT246_07775 [Bacteroidia bacterium]|nr:hypothetical protein [Bacteroidia bacterium]